MSSKRTNNEEEPSELDDEEDTIIHQLDPKLQAYLARVSQENGCWGRFFPIPFERAAQRSWWDPTFDSDILEEQYKKSSSPYNRFKFRYALWYMFLVTLSWLFYLLISGFLLNANQFSLCTIFGVFTICSLLIIFLTYTNYYQNYTLLVSLITAFLFCFISLLLIIVPIFDLHDSNHTESGNGNFSMLIEVLMLIYTLIPLKLYMTITIGFLYSITFELLLIFVQQTERIRISLICLKILSHFCIHLIGLHIFIMTNVRSRNTFMKVGQSLLVRKQLELEKRLKENMIHSLMPPSVANWLLLNNNDEDFLNNYYDNRKNSNSTIITTTNNDIRSLFRPFNMNRMENVSILFADIVGFTKMSSNKSAEELVEILNNLFQRFDSLCKYNNCEKISTLGDCYYCVSGCPEPRLDHAKCCVEMGLNMIEAIQQFDMEQNETVNIRVGVHTGTVLCGIVGTKRFKFDVWSNDVTLANRMESSGNPGMVHISERTKDFLNEDDLYLMEEGEPVFGMKTYFILGKNNTSEHTPPSYSGSFRADGRQKYTNSLHLFVSPPPQQQSSPVSPQTRPRVFSCDQSRDGLLKTQENQTKMSFLSPDPCKIKANSLPSILDTENNDNSNNKILNDNNNMKTPTSTSSSGKYKMKNWKIPKFLSRKSTDKEISDENSDGYQQVPTIIESLHKTDDEIDIKSYISQSRSDIGQYEYNSRNDLNQFFRTNSYRSHKSPNNNIDYLHRSGSQRSRRGKSPNFDLLPPIMRDRSATVAITGHLDSFNKQKSLMVPDYGRLSMLEDHFLMCSVGGSRKDSGIKSNSRRSSIQQLDPPEQVQNRLSGYFTSSQSTMNSPPINVPPAVPSPQIVPTQSTAFYDKFGTCIQNLRKQSDRQLIKCVQDNSKSKSSYFLKPPLTKFLLFFKDKQMEYEYRHNVHSIHFDNDQILTLANSRFNTYFDIFVSSVIFFIISFSLLFIIDFNYLWLSFFICFTLIELFGFCFCFKKIVKFTELHLNCLSKFYRWNMFGGILVSLPLLTVLINFTSNSINYYHLLLISVIHFCNFTQLNCWMKNFLVTFYITIFILLIFNTNQTDLVKYEILMNLILLLILVWLLNREFEIGYRLSFHANFVSNRDKINVQTLKNQADYLIYNIVPEHVAEQLKKNAKYSENFKNIGIIFASIVNFNEMYDESYLGGKEFLRVLNELIGDFDELLNKPEYENVEKIKTIGSTFMAASGLDPDLRCKQTDPNQHLFALMDFVLDMQNVINDFNRDLLEFNLILRVGYNFGEVTAAVIGNTKLYYDIWGDAVNIASRMDSTGVNGHIQVGEHCLSVLEQKYVFERRGSIYVKGKDNMNVYLLHHKKGMEE